jgi:predicted nucleic acid-binding protein
LSRDLRVVFDTDFLSAFLKIDRPDIVRRYFDIETALVPPAVYREIAATDLLEKLVAVPWLQVQGPDTPVPALSGDRDFPNLGQGEREAIALAAERSGSMLLMNDNKAPEHGCPIGCYRDQYSGLPPWL